MRKGEIIKGGLQIVYIPIKDIKPYERNPRMNDKAVEKVAESIKEYGFKIPVVLDKNNVIVCGHTRVKACEQLGIKEVPCIIVEDLTDTQIKAFSNIQIYLEKLE